MFEDSLVESSGRIKTKRAWTSGISVLLQVCMLGVFILIPLIYTEALPKASMMTFLVAPPPPPPPPPPPAAAAPVKPQKVVTEVINNQLKAPTKIPDKIKMVKEEEAPPTEMTGVIGGVTNGTANGSPNGVIGGIVTGIPTAIPKVAAPQKVRISGGVMAGSLISQQKPIYPPIAKAARIQGQVVLQATISKQGTIEGLRAVSGPPMLFQSALDAVKTWRYKPYQLNGEPVEVETTIQVNFNLNSGG